MSPTLQKLLIPIAIVIAGLLVAGSIIFVELHQSGTAAASGQTQTKPIPLVSKDDHIQGNPNAKVVIVEYSDPECPFCKQFNTTLEQIMAKYGSTGDVAWVYRHFPIPQLHPKAPKEAEALECVNELGGADKFWQYEKLIYQTTNSNNSLDDGVYNTPEPVPTDANGTPYYTEKKPASATDAGELSAMAVQVGVDKTAFEQCLASGKYAGLVSQEANDAMAAGGNGTPFSVILIGKQQIPIEGAQPLSTIEGLIDQVLNGTSTGQ
ncbi:MAG TPA: thioredoxin domain-containing protein [Candidatus Paceibacterota bacterium]|nr:thioredoxin domain-containing protein [Candidatus Paceibacterota bacterium]